MENKIVLLLGIHNHQPVGNFEHIFETAYRDAYEPFLRLIHQFPGIKFNIHYSGVLWEWFEKRHPELFPLIASLVGRGQISLISGGFYEPLLSLLPVRDAQEQIAVLNNYLRDKFGFKPRGFWLTERVWEPSIPDIVSPTGLEYTMVDDTHFLKSGLARDRIHGAFITEDKGNILKIFPIDKRLRYMIPFRMPEETIGYLREAREGGVEALTLADDGEKFGLWPGTKKWVYEEKWLYNFLTELRKNEFIETLTFEEYLERKKRFPRVYLSAASYDEMLEWSGGFFRNFLAKYPEAQNLYSKMLWVSRKVHLTSPRMRKKEKEVMKSYLWKGQCSCPYWHGVFGGLYLPYLREANYTNLINAEVMAGRRLKTDLPALTSADFDHDGEDELLAETEALNIYFKPSSGGGIFELDYKPMAINPAPSYSEEAPLGRRGGVNLQDVLSRRIEPYHKDITFSPAKEQGGHVSIHELGKKAAFDPKKFLVYDEYERSSFLLRMMNFLKEDMVKDGRKGEWGETLSGPYSAETEVRRGKLSIYFRKKVFSGALIFNILKKVHLYKKGGEIGYEIEIALEKGEWQGYIGVEFCLSILNGRSVIRNDSFGVTDSRRNLRINFRASPECRWWTGTVETVSQSEKGYELIPQAMIVFPHWKVNLKLGKKADFYLTERIS